jgi:DNA primase
MLAMSIYDKIAERISHKGLAAMVGVEINRSGMCSCPMPWHDDKTPSCHIYRQGNRTVAYCFGCQRMWSPVQFYAAARGVSETDAARVLSDGTTGPQPVRRSPPVQPIPPEVVEASHDNLMRNPALLPYLTDERGLSLDIIREFKIGFDGSRYTIPVADESGEWRNMRMYNRRPPPGKSKMTSWRTGYGTARIYPIGPLLRASPGDKVFIFEGEWDCLCARSRGREAFTGTGGAGIWRKGWNVLFSGLDVVICYDVDYAGRKGARKVAESLAQPRPHR